MFLGLQPRLRQKRYQTYASSPEIRGPWHQIYVFDPAEVNHSPNSSNTLGRNSTEKCSVYPFASIVTTAVPSQRILGLFTSSLAGATISTKFPLLSGFASVASSLEIKSPYLHFQPQKVDLLMPYF